VAELVAVAEALGATVYHQPMYDGVDFPLGHPLYGGMLAATNAGIHERLAAHDMVLIVGTHAFMAHHYTPGPAVPDGTRILQLDSDPAEIGRNFGVEWGMTGAIRPTLAALAESLAGQVPQAAGRMAAAAARARDRHTRTKAAALARYGPAPLDPLAAAHAVAAGLPADAVVVEEAITVGVKLREVLTLDRPGSYVHTVGGGLGSGIGAAIGTRLGDAGRPVVAVLGDGCTMFGLQGLWSAARYRVPVTFVVMNNGEYRTLKDTLDTWQSSSTAAGRYIGLDLGPPSLDFTTAAAFFGIDAERVTSADHLAEMVAKAASANGPLLIDVPITGHPASTPGGPRPSRPIRPTH
jgi:benzoylformate decarboxylase